MEESDNLLISQLKRHEFQIPDGLKSLKEIDSDLLISIGIQFLQKTDVAISKALLTNQKFRKGTKLSEDLNKFHGIRVDVNTLMNPNLNDMRKTLMLLMSKMPERKEIHPIGETIQDRIQRQKEQLRRQIFLTWLREDWVHPCLIDQKNAQKFRTHETNVQIEGKSLRRTYIIQNFDSEIKSNMFASVARVLDLASQKATEQRKQQEEAYMAGEEDIRTKQAQKHAIQINDMKSKNHKEWVVQKGEKQVKKAVQKLVHVEAPVTTEQPTTVEQQHVIEQIERAEMTAYAGQIAFQAPPDQQPEEVVVAAEEQVEVVPPEQEPAKTIDDVPDEAMPENDDQKSTTSTAATTVVESIAPTVKEPVAATKEPVVATKEPVVAVQAPPVVAKKEPPVVAKKEPPVVVQTPAVVAKKKRQIDLEAVRNKNRAEIAELQSQLEELSKKMEKYENKKTTYEEQIVQKQEEVENYKEANVDLNKKVQQLELLVKQLEVKDGNKELRNVIKVLEKDISEIEHEWNQHKQKVVSDIEKIRDQSRKKFERLDQMRDKLQRIDGEIKQVVQDTRNGYDRKEKLVEEFKKMPKEGDREVYVRKIQQITTNYHKQQEDLKKIIEDVKSQDTQIDYQLASLDRYYVEFENSYNTDSKKNESLSKQIYKIYKEYREIFDSTVQNLRDLGKKKIEVRNLEVKVDVLSTKGYKLGLEKVKHDLEDIKAENARLEKQQ